MLRLPAFFMSLLSLPVFAASPSHIIFGDSLSDEGRIYQATNQQFPPSPFYEGRFSNGPVWAEHLEGERMNYAFAGAKSDYTNMLTPKLGNVVDNTGLFAQIDKYFEEDLARIDPSQAHFYISIGANDFLEMVEGSGGDLERFIPDIVDNIIDSAKRLRSAGATDILLIGLPNLSKIPLANDMTLHEKQLIALASMKFNKLLESQAQHHAFSYYDMDAFVNKIMKNFKAYGLTNIEDACFDEVNNIDCSNPEEYFFWDNKHPTEKVHQLFAQTLR